MYMLNLADANSYFKERLYTDEWDNSNDNKKKAALSQAQREIDDLGISKFFSPEDYQRAIFEQALFLLELGPEDRKRLNLQAQGVQSINISGSISEAYVLNGTPYAPAVKQISGKKKYNRLEYRVGDML